MKEKSYISKLSQENLSLMFLARPRGYKTFSCSTQRSTKSQLLINTTIRTNKEVFALCLSDVVFIMLINVKMSTIQLLAF